MACLVLGVSSDDDLAGGLRLDSIARSLASVDRGRLCQWSCRARSRRSRACLDSLDLCLASGSGSGSAILAGREGWALLALLWLPRTVVWCC